MHANFHNNTILRLTAILLAGIVLLTLGACRVDQEYTYPRGAINLNTEQVHSSMKKMAVSINKLDKLLHETTSVSSIQKEKVLAELDAITQATEDLGARASVSDHRVISDNMGDFRKHVSKARIAVDTEQPDYFLAGQLVGQCLDCHYKNAAVNDTF